MINEEGAIVPEQFRMVEMFDRVDCLGKAVLGLTTQCAQCHSHKFDPLTHDEYYGLFAFLNNSYEAQSWVYTPEQQRQISEIHGRIRDAERALRKERPQWEQEMAAWEQKLLKEQAAWEPLDRDRAGEHQRPESSDAGSRQVVPDERPSQQRRLHHRDARARRCDRASAGSARTIATSRTTGPGRSRLGTWGISELEAFVKKPAGKDWEKLKLVNATADYSEPEQKECGRQEGQRPRRPSDRRQGRHDLDGRSGRRPPQSAVGRRSCSSSTR